MSDDEYSDGYSDEFAFYDDYYEDDDLAALVDSMAETAFAQGEANWDGLEIAYETAEYHSDWDEYYSDGEFYEDERVAPSIAGSGDKQKGGLGNGGGKVGDVGGAGRTKVLPRKRRKSEDGTPGVRGGGEERGGGKKGTAVVIVPVTVEREDIVVGGEEQVVNGDVPLEKTSSVELVGGQAGVTVISPPLGGEGAALLAREPAKNIERGQKQADLRKRKPSTEIESQ